MSLDLPWGCDTSVLEDADAANELFDQLLPSLFLCQASGQKHRIILFLPPLQIEMLIVLVLYGAMLRDLTRGSGFCKGGSH